jgi:proteasome lid subunit RPN8/RPN11
VSEREAREGLPSAEDWSTAAEAGSAASRPPGMGRVLREATLPAMLLQEIVAAARADVPNETVGLLVGESYAADGGQPNRYLQLTNAAASPYRYLLDPQEQLQVLLALDDADEVVWGIVHSHVGSPPVPSATDVGLAFYPDSLYLICSLAGERPEIRAWSIRDDEVSEVPLAVA